MPRVNQVPKASAEPRRAAACGIACVFGAIRTENFRQKFRGRKIFGPRSLEIAPKSVPPADARPFRESNTSPKTLCSVGVPRCVGLQAKSARFGPKILEKNFAAAKFSVRDRLRSRQIPCRPTMPGLAASQTRPQRHCQASACRGVWDCMRNRRGSDRKFSEKTLRPQNFRSEIA